jgi:hypothetical protein
MVGAEDSVAVTPGTHDVDGDATLGPVRPHCTEQASREPPLHGGPRLPTARPTTGRITDREVATTARARKHFHHAASQEMERERSELLLDPFNHVLDSADC